LYFSVSVENTSKQPRHRERRWTYATYR